MIAQSWAIVCDEAVPVTRLAVDYCQMLSAAALHFTMSHAVLAEELRTNHASHTKLMPQTQ